jgi:hypothetical protein
MSNNESDLALAARHVREGRIIVARQEECIRRLRALGCSTLDAEQTLQVFFSTLAIFEDHEKVLHSARIGIEDAAAGVAGAVG